MPVTKFSDDLTVENLIDGECDVPDILQSFYTTLLCGTRTSKESSEYTIRIKKSLFQDAIFTVTNGCVKTSKHVTLGLTLKGLTNSKKIVNILNNYGHCCSYTVLEGLETEAYYTSLKNNNLCPDDIKRVPHLSTTVALNNFDRFVETTSGKDTLHDTVGIIFQNIDRNGSV